MLDRVLTGSHFFFQFFFYRLKRKSINEGAAGDAQAFRHEPATQDASYRTGFRTSAKVR